MTVKELIQKLKKCDPTATVGIWPIDSDEVNNIVQFTTEDGLYVYLTDNAEDMRDSLPLPLEYIMKDIE